jgi:heat shock protein HslJ
MTRPLTLAFILLLLAACGPPPSPAGPGDTATPPGSGNLLVGTEWVLTSLRGEAPLEGTHISLKFQEEIVVGFAGCNAYGGGGGYTFSPDGSLEIPAPARTEMACLGPEGVMDQEDAFFEALTSAASYSLAGDQLEIQNEAGETVLVFSRREPVTMDPTELAGTAWRLVTTDGLEPTQGSSLTLSFHGEGRASGYAGCRDYVMSYHADAAMLSFYFTAMLGPVCDDEAQRLQEGEYTTVLSWVDRYVLEGSRLELHSVRGETLTYEPLPAEAQPPLEGTAWTLLSFIEPNRAEDVITAPQELLKDTEISLAFSDGQVTGNAGCNSYGGSYTLDAGSLSVGDLFQTEMACLDPEGVMEQESRFLDMLGRATQAHVFGTQLWLETEDGRGLVFKALAGRALGSHPLASAQEALAAYVPAADAQPLVSTLLSEIAGWLNAGGEPATLEAILNETAFLVEHKPVTINGLDLTGDSRQDVVVHIPVMGLPLLVFVDDGGTPAPFAGYALPPDLEAIRTDFPLKMVNHPPGRQVWRWNPGAEEFVLSEDHVDLERSAWGSGSEPDLPVTVGDQLRWLTNEAEAAFRTGAYQEALRGYGEVLRQAEAGNWHPEEGEADWRAYAAFRHAGTLLLLGQPSSGLPEIAALATEMEGDLLDELARAFLEGYGDGSSADSVAGGVAAMQAVDLYAHFFYERPGALRFPMDARGILYPGAGLAAYLTAHPEIADDPSAVQVGLQALGFDVEEVTLLEGGDLHITLRLPERPYAGKDLALWLLTPSEGAWHVSLPVGGSGWPTVGTLVP